MKNSISLYIFLITYLLKVEGEVANLRIIGGYLAKKGEFPYQVSLQKSWNNRHFCGGSLITPRHVLTAAHCMYYSWGGVLPPLTVKVAMGETDLNSSIVVKNVSQIFIHPEFDSQSLVNDVAIVELDSEIVQNDFISTITLNDRNVPWNTSCVVSGWGVLVAGSSTISTNLMATEVFTLDDQECGRRYAVIGVSLKKGMLCANNDEKPTDACQGDSGGPLVCEGRLTGVVSAGKDCASLEFSGIYSDVKYFKPWIEEILGEDLLNTPEITAQSSVLPHFMNFSSSASTLKKIVFAIIFFSSFLQYFSYFSQYFE